MLIRLTLMPASKIPISLTTLSLSIYPNTYFYLREDGTELEWKARSHRQSRHDDRSYSCSLLLLLDEFICVPLSSSRVGNDKYCVQRERAVSQSCLRTELLSTYTYTHPKDRLPPTVRPRLHQSICHPPTATNPYPAGPTGILGHSPGPSWFKFSFLY